MLKYLPIILISISLLACTGAGGPVGGGIGSAPVSGNAAAPAERPVQPVSSDPINDMEKKDPLVFRPCESPEDTNCYHNTNEQDRPYPEPIIGQIADPVEDEDVIQNNDQCRMSNWLENVWVNCADLNGWRQTFGDQLPDSLVNQITLAQDENTDTNFGGDTPPKVLLKLPEDTSLNSINTNVSVTFEVYETNTNFETNEIE